MEILFRKNFWVINGVFIALAAWLAARTVNIFVEAALAPAPSNEAPRTASAPIQVEAPAQLDGKRLAKLTGLPQPVEPKLTQEPLGDMSDEPVKTTLRVRLLGTLISDHPEWCFASIQDVSTTKSTTYMVGDLIQGAEILEIERAKVIIKHGGRREYISSEAGDGSAVAEAPPPVPVSQPVKVASGPPGSNVTGSGIKAIDENNYEVPRPEIDKTLSNLNDVAMQARIVPAFQDGVAKGFKLFSIRPDSIYTKIGVQNGDVIRRINGYDLNSPEKALEVYSKLKEASRIDIEIERNGSVIRKTYNIR